MEGADDVSYGNYSQYKFFDGVELEWPYEIADDISIDIVSFIRRNMQIFEINSQVNFLFVFYLLVLQKSEGKVGYEIWKMLACICWKEFWSLFSS